VARGKEREVMVKEEKEREEKESFVVDAGDDDEIHCAYALITPKHTPHASHAPTHITLSDSAMAGLTEQAAAPLKKSAMKKAAAPSKKGAREILLAMTQEKMTTRRITGSLILIKADSIFFSFLHFLISYSYLYNYYS
jgi:hypothetical protein